MLRIDNKYDIGDKIEFGDKPIKEGVIHEILIRKNKKSENIWLYKVKGKEFSYGFKYAIEEEIITKSKKVETKIIKICTIKIPLFQGTDELKKFILNNSICTNFEDYEEFEMELLKEISSRKDKRLNENGTAKVRKDLNLLIKELEDNNFDYLRIES